MFVLSDGLILPIKKLSGRRSSKGNEQGVSTEKLSKKLGDPWTYDVTKRLIKTWYKVGCQCMVRCPCVHTFACANGV